MPVTDATLAQLQQYDIVFGFAGGWWNDAVAMGNALADYEDGGGVVVAGSYAWDNNGPQNLQGRWMTGGYMPYNSTDQQLSSYSTGQHHRSVAPVDAGSERPERHLPQRLNTHVRRDGSRNVDRRPAGGGVQDQQR